MSTRTLKKNGFTWTALLLTLFILTAPWAIAEEDASEIPRKRTLSFSSTLDQSLQPVQLYRLPGEEARPLLVVLHYWSCDLKNFDASEWVKEAASRGWHVVAPHFRGANNKPEACASPLAKQDVLDAVEFACAKCPVNRNKIYLAGVSGGGHMAMMMASVAPELWTAVTAWVGISDLSLWHKESKARDLKYAGDIEKVVGGAPGDSPEIDKELYDRSPINFIADAKNVPMDLNTGIHDGHDGSVPIHHTLDAFNVLARSLCALEVPQVVIDQLSREDTEGLEAEQDESYGRRIHLRNYAGPSRVTVFEGKHEEIIPAACAWLAKH